MENLDRLCIHTVTTKPWSLDIAVDQFARAGVPGIAVWRDVIADRDVAAAGRLIRDAGLGVVSLVRGGFFPATDKKGRREAIKENRRAIDEAEKLGSPLICIVCGADPNQPLGESRKQILDALSELAPEAANAGVRLAIEPLHPMYADTRSAIVTLKDANDACEELGIDNVGVAIDVYHVWWDPDLEGQIRRTGELGKLFAFHVCDWRVPTRDFFRDRVIMGEGCIEVTKIRRLVDEAGYQGFIEVELFSNDYWTSDQSPYLQRIIQAYRDYV
jgi:sugar phosphate isomerase/epimerase